MALNYNELCERIRNWFDLSSSIFFFNIYWWYKINYISLFLIGFALKKKSIFQSYFYYKITFNLSIDLYLKRPRVNLGSLYDIFIYFYIIVSWISEFSTVIFVLLMFCIKFHDIIDSRYNILSKQIKNLTFWTLQFLKNCYFMQNEITLFILCTCNWNFISFQQILLRSLKCYII